MDGKSFLDTLETQHTFFMNTGGTIDSLIDDIEFYESFIPDFFSKNGEANGIKNMYKGIKDSLYEEKSVECIDINKSSSIYEDYMNGMMSFISDIGNVNINESCDELKSFEEKFEKAKDKDSLFIQSLYNGKLNDISPMVLSEAVGNIEFLIDFIPKLKEIKESCINLNDTFNKDMNKNKKALVDQSLKMLYESVDNYCYNTIKNVVTTYNDINGTLFNQNLDKGSEAESDNFKLF